MTIGARAPEAFCLLLLAAAFAVIQALIGGMRLIFSLPAYGLLAVIGLLSILFLRRVKPEPDQLCLVSSALFFGYVLGRAVLSPVPYLARADIYSILGGLLVYLFVACYLTNARSRLLLLGFLLAAAIVHVLIGAVQFRHGQNFMLIPFLHRHDYGRRASGFYVCPNHLAGLLEVLGVFGLAIVCWSRWPTWAKLLIGYAAIISYFGIALTGSRGGYLSTGASLAVFAALSLVVLRRAGSGLFWRIGGVSIIAACLVGVAAFFLLHKSDYLSGRAQNVFDKSNMRLDLWKAAIPQWKLSPWMGTGSGTYLYYGRLFRTERIQVDPVHVHNDYLHLLAEYGICGAAGFLLFLGCHFRRGWKNFLQLGPKRVAVSSGLLSNGLALQIGALGALAAYIVHSFVDFNLHIPANVLLLALVFGILANAGIQRENRPVASKISLLMWRLALPVIGLFLLIQCARLLPGEYFTERSRAALRDNHPTLSIFYALQGLKYEQSNPFLYQYLGSARMEQGDLMPSGARDSFYRAAIEAFEKGRALAPQEKAFAHGLGIIYDALGRFEEAEWMYGQANALDPKFLPARSLYEAHLQKWKASGAPAKQ
jgi:O-antigen ligase